MTESVAALQYLTVVQIIVFCTNKVQAVRDYISKSRWNQAGDEGGVTARSGPEIRVVSSGAAMSAGDALRELDSMGCVRSDPFVLITGDVVSNMNLSTVIESHNARRKADKQCILTTVWQQQPRTSRNRSLRDDTVVAIDDVNGQLLYYTSDASESSMSIKAVRSALHPTGRAVHYKKHHGDCDASF